MDEGGVTGRDALSPEGRDVVAAVTSTGGFPSSSFHQLHDADLDAAGASTGRIRASKVPSADHFVAPTVIPAGVTSRDRAFLRRHAKHDPAPTLRAWLGVLGDRDFAAVGGPAAEISFDVRPRRIERDPDGPLR